MVKIDPGIFECQSMLVDVMVTLTSRSDFNSNPRFDTACKFVVRALETLNKIQDEQV